MTFLDCMARRQPATSSHTNILCAQLVVRARTTKPSLEKVMAAEMKFCSFCLKNQDDVSGIIAGRDVYICNECVDLCNDLFFDKGIGAPRKSNEFAFGVSVFSQEKESDIDFFKQQSIVAVLQEAFPKYKFILNHVESVDSGSLIKITVVAPRSDDTKGQIENVRRLTHKIKELEESYWAEKENRKLAEVALNDLRAKVVPLLLDKLYQAGDIPNSRAETLAIMFIDIVGFSKKSAQEQEDMIAMLRAISKAVLGRDNAMYMNTWGGAIVAGFSDPNADLRCACRLMNHLDIENIDTRISMSWGSVRISTNEITKREDIVGDSINEAARLESIAKQGAVYITESLRHHSLIDQSAFIFIEQALKIHKSYSDKPAGTEIMAYACRLASN